MMPEFVGNKHGNLKHSLFLFDSNSPIVFCVFFFNPLGRDHVIVDLDNRGPRQDLCEDASMHKRTGACIERESLKRAGSTHGRHAFCTFLREMILQQLAVCSNES